MATGIHVNNYILKNLWCYKGLAHRIVRLKFHFAKLSPFKELPITGKIFIAYNLST